MFKLLSSQFEETQQTLKNVEENIRRLTGRDPPDNSVGNRRRFPGDTNFRNQNGFMARKRPMPFNKNAPIVKKEEQEVEEEEEEESADEDGPKKKPALQSTIVTTQKNPKSRRDTLLEQKGDKRIFARNRRMFGMILGTLQKFQSEETRRKDQITKKAEVDKKVEQAAEEEKEKMKREKQELFLTRKEKQIQIRCLEKKLEIAEIHDVWEHNHSLLLNFIQTTAKPPIMFLPTKHNIKSQKSLHDTQGRISALISASRERLDKEMLQIEECYNRDTEEMETENIIDKENHLDSQYESNHASENQEGEVLNGAVNEIVADNQINADVSNDATATVAIGVVGNPERTGIIDATDKTEDGETEGAGNEVGDQDEFEPIYD